LQGSSTIVSSLKGKSVEELRKLMHDTEAYKKFLESLDEVRRLDKLRNELSNGNVDESRKNLEKESEIAELRNQCMIIRNTELAAAQEKFEEVEKQYKEVHARCSPQSLLDKLQSAANDADDESENLHRKLLSGEIELGEFIQIYRKQRILFHRRTLIRMAALTSLTTPG
jgi:ESCRT-I complex subunit VPS37